MGVRWPDRRPIGVLFLASNYYSTPANPRGWFNDEKLDISTTNGQAEFRAKLFDYAAACITNIQRVGGQGIIVWDVEGEEFPHKTSFIGDPRTIASLAPEMAPVVNEFFKRFRDAGLRVGVTIRPQELVFNEGAPRQATALDIKEVLLEKIDYARTNWGATIFYIDSNDGIWRPDEAWQLKLLAKEQPDVLLIPEHHYLPYWSFGAPYVSMRKGNPDITTWLARGVYPGTFKVLDIADATKDRVASVWRRGDIVLFRAWYWNSDCDVAQSLQPKQP